MDSQSHQTLQNANSESLMLAYTKGDIEAFTQLYNQHKGPLFRFIVRQGFSKARAEELFQDIWLKIINARHQYKPSARFQTWLYSIARNRVIDEYRKQGKANEIALETEFETDLDNKSNDEYLEDVSQPTADAELHNSRTKADIMDAVNGLPFEQRQSFLLKYDAGMSNDDIAMITGTSKEAAKSRVRYAIKRLKRTLGGTQ